MLYKVLNLKTTKIKIKLIILNNLKIKLLCFLKKIIVSKQNKKTAKNQFYQILIKDKTFKKIIIS